MATFRSGTQYSLIEEDPSVPVRRTGNRQVDRSRWRERHWLIKDVGRRRPSMWLVIHATGLTLVAISAFTFWSWSSQHPILHSLNVQLILRSKPKIATSIWTSIGTLLSALTVYFLNGVLYHTAAQKIAFDGATVSSIEVWNKLANQKALLSRNRWRVSLFTVVAWVSAAFLTSAYTTLVTPTSVIVHDAMNGTELDFASPSFWDWYNTFDPNTGRPVRKIFGCTWYRYKSPTGEAVFPTCPFLGDPSSFLAAGIVAAQTANGTTGGTLASGPDGVAAFDNSQVDAPSGYAGLSYNYSLIQQGLTAFVNCQETVGAPITREVVAAANVTDAPPGAGGVIGEEVLQSFQLNDTTNNCLQWQQVMTSASASVACAICQPDAALKEYLIYLQPYGSYTEQNVYSGAVAFPCLTCSLQPRLTVNNVSYSAATGLFTSTVLDVDSRLYLVPNETAESIHLLVNIAATSWGNMVIDALYALQMTGHSTISMAAAVEAMLRGFIEFEGTNLRMYYTANEAPGFRDVTGTMTTTRLGYVGQRTVLYFLVPPLAVICCLCILYLSIAIRTGVRYSGTFDPTNTTCLILGGAAAGKNGRLAVVGDGSGVDKLERRGVLEMRVKFEEGAGLVDAWSGGTKLDAL